VTRRLLLFLLVAGVAATPALGSERHPTLTELEGRVMCPTCKTTLDQSNAPIAERMREFIRGRIAGGDTRSQIEEKLVQQFGPGVLAAPPKSGFGLLAWLLPLVGLGVGAVVVGALAWRWSRKRPSGAGDEPAPELNGRAPLDPELERRVDEELARFDG
jgi:cytochrome c-type biogenesis protein CcmH